MSTIPLADLPALAHQAARTRVLRRAAAAAALASLAFALGLTLRGDDDGVPYLPPGSDAIVVLDVSASISSDTFARIDATLSRLVRGGGRYGLVLFSDTAYQALPPGTPAVELERFRRFFRVEPRRFAGAQALPPRGPWTDAFSAGTRISTGLGLARDIVLRERLGRPAVLLVSDLDNDAGDLDRLTSVVLAFRESRIPLEVVGLNPSPEDERFVRRLLPRGGEIALAPLPEEHVAGAHEPFSAALVAVALAAAASVAAFLFVTRPFRWGRLA